MILKLGHNKEHPFRFNQKKAIQAVAFLLKQSPETNKSDDYMRLLKLLYFADRESIEHTGKPITGDKFTAFEHGPSLSLLYDLVRQKGVNNIEWDKYIERDGFHIRLINDPGNDELCRYELELLTKIWQKYREMNVWEVADESHKLKEWQKNDPGKSSRPIPLLDLLEAIGKSDWLNDILKATQEESEIDCVLGIE